MTSPIPSTTPTLSRDVARLLGISLPVLYALVRTGRTPEPPRDSSHRYIWSEVHIDAARHALTVDRRRREHKRKEAHHGAT